MKKAISFFVAGLCSLSTLPLSVSAQDSFDFNNDGLINGFDVQLMLERYCEISIDNYLSKFNMTEDMRMLIDTVGDINGDEIIDGRDASLLLIDIKNNNIKGDVNCDGNLDGRDASFVLYYYSMSSVNQEIPYEKKWIEIGVTTLGDYNSDGFIDANDATAIITYYAQNSIELNEF